MRIWAFWRRTIYLTCFSVLVFLVGFSIYRTYMYEAPTCFDGEQNGGETGQDCGGTCVRICRADVISPSVIWSKAFEIVPGQYNAVAYVENRNIGKGAPDITYTLSLYDEGGLILERTGTTILPPDSTYPIFEGRIDTGKRIPTRTEFHIDDREATWLPAEMGREQFVIEDRFLTNADKSPRLDARITNTALAPVRDVEVVATIFDAKRNPLTASRTYVPYFNARTTENVVFTWPNPIAKTVRSCEVPTDVMLAIDLSGSMNDDGGTPPQPVTSVLKAASAFVSRLKSKDQIGVVTYATEAVTRRTLTTDRESTKTFVSSLAIVKADETGSTNTGEAIMRATEELNSVRHNENARKVLVLLTDGLANAPEKEPEAYALEAASNLKKTNADIYVIGLGEKLNETFLRSLASSERHYYKAPSSGTVDNIYKTITSAICEDGAAVIDIVPKSEAVFAPLR